MKTQQHFLVLLLVFGAMRLSAQTIPPLSVSADGDGPYAYQWYVNKDSSNVGGTLIPGATDSVYTPNQYYNIPYYYYCIITNNCGNTTSEVSGSYTITALGCSTAEPKFLNKILGATYYGSESNMDIETGTTKISANGITQEWSQPVLAAGCNKTTYAGGSEGNYLSDCRKGTASGRSYAGYGDLFSFCAVTRYRQQLCPKPWRVPTLDDFKNLDIALGGTGNIRDTDNPLGIRAKYVATTAGGWAGAWGGHCDVAGTLHGQGASLHYWSSWLTNATVAYSHYLAVDLTGGIYPQGSYYKSYGFAVRCVR